MTTAGPALPERPGADGGARLVVSADLRCDVVAPDGSRGGLTLRGDGTGPLALDVHGPRALWRARPQGPVAGAPDLRSVVGGLLGLVPDEVRRDLAATDVDVRVDGRRVASWRRGALRPSPAVAVAGTAATVLAGLAVAALLGAAGAVAARVLASRRAGR